MDPFFLQREETQLHRHIPWPFVLDHMSSIVCHCRQDGDARGLFFKKYFCHAIKAVPNLPASTQPPTLPEAIPRPLSTSVGPAQLVLWLLYSLCCTLHPHEYSVTTYLYLLIPSPFSPSSQTPSHPATIKMFSVSMMLFLLCWFYVVILLDSVVLLPFYCSYV